MMTGATPHAVCSIFSAITGLRDNERMFVSRSVARRAVGNQQLAVGNQLSESLGAGLPAVTSPEA
jgi:hypothetical protein